MASGAVPIQIMQNVSEETKSNVGLKICWSWGEVSSKFFRRYMADVTEKLFIKIEFDILSIHLDWSLYLSTLSRKNLEWNLTQSLLAEPQT